MNEFDPIRALHEQIAGLITAERLVRASAGHKDEIIDEATHERDALLIAAAQFKNMIANLQAERRALEDEAEQKAKRQ